MSSIRGAQNFSGSESQLSKPRSLNNFKRVSQTASLLVILIGCLTLLGWQLNLTALKSGMLGATTMKANTAIVFILTGGSLWLLTSRSFRYRMLIARSLALIALLIGAFTLSQYLFGWNLGIDQLLFRDLSPSPTTSYPGRMGIVTALNILLAETALLLSSRSTHRTIGLAQFLSVITLLSSLQVLIGYAYGVHVFFRYSIQTAPMAVPTALTFLILGVGILFVYPDRVAMPMITGSSMGSLTARRLLPMAIVLPFALGWLILKAQQFGFYEPALGMSLLVIMLTTIIAILLWRNAIYLNRLDRDRDYLVDALQATNQRLTFTLESTTDGFFALDQDWRFIYFNPQAEHLLQTPRSILLGQVIWESFPEMRETIVYDQFQQAIIEQKSVKYEVHYKPLSLWLEVHAFPSLEGIAVYFKDIGERKQSEAAIKTSNDRLKSFVSANVIGMLIGNVDGGIQEANDELLRIIGYTRDDLATGKLDWVNLTPPEHLPLDIKGVAEAQERGACTPYEKEYIRQDGSRVPVLVGYSLVGEERYESVAFILDLSDRKRIEQERSQLVERAQAAQREAENANRMKDEFLAVVSHELRSPLNAILGWLTLLRTRNFDATTTARALETVERNARAQAQLIEDLLDISRIIQGQLRLNVQTINPITVIEAAIETVRPSAEAKSIRLQSVLDPTAAPILGDTNRLQQVIWNLLSNAIKFTPKDGRVQICLQRINSHIEIIVTDTGQGIQAEFLPYVFDRFRQADSSITRTYGGLGLGLSIVRHLVELHGGTVEVESPGLGQGTTFTVKLPRLPVTTPTVVDRVHPTVEPALPPAMPDAPSLQGVRILIVDDEADARELIAQVLSGYGAEVMMAATANDAIARLQNISLPPVDLLISDIGMPEEDGYALLRRVRSLEARAGGRIPAIALTAFARSEDRKAALLGGFQAHVAKPVDPSELAIVAANLTGKTP